MKGCRQAFREEHIMFTLADTEKSATPPTRASTDNSTSRNSDLNSRPAPETSHQNSLCSLVTPSSKADPSDVHKSVTLATNMGTVGIELYWLHAPRTCKNFFELSKSGFYDNCIFHRIVKDLCIQGGDPTGTGRGGRSIYGETFEDEIHPDLHHSGAGIFSMANFGKDTNGSQFFITLAPTPFLDSKNTIFGRVKSGMDVVRKMSTVHTTATDRPVFDVKILRASTA